MTYFVADARQQLANHYWIVGRLFFV